MDKFTVAMKYFPHSELLMWLFLVHFHNHNIINNTMVTSSSHIYCMCFVLFFTLLVADNVWKVSVFNLALAVMLTTKHLGD